MASLAEIRAKLQEANNRSSGNSTGGGDNAIYPHWNMQEGREAVVRFLPDGNADNTFFWVERAMIKLPFAGIKGETDSVVILLCKFRVWKCTTMVLLVQFFLRYVVGLKTNH